MKIDAGPDQDLILKGRSATMSTYDNSYVVVSPDVGGARIGLKDGTTFEMTPGTIKMMVTDGNGNVTNCITLTSDGIMIAHQGTGVIASTVLVNDGGVTAAASTGQSISMVAPNVLLGPVASPITAAVVAPMGAPGMIGVASMSVFISP